MEFYGWTIVIIELIYFVTLDFSDYSGLMQFLNLVIDLLVVVN